MMAASCRADGLVRPLLSRDFNYTKPRPTTHPPLFVSAPDLTNESIAIYETNYMARTMPLRWIVPLFGNLERLDAFLRNSNLEACFPVSAATAACGHDGHSEWHGWNRGLPKL